MSDNQDQPLSQSELLDALELEIKKIETTGIQHILSRLSTYVAGTGDWRAGWEAHDMFVYNEEKRINYLANLILNAANDGLAQYKQKAQTNSKSQTERKDA